MDVILLTSLAILIIVLIIVCTLFLGQKSAARKTNTAEKVAQAKPVRRAAGQRNTRRRMQATTSQQVEENDHGSENEEDEEANEKSPAPDFKMGAKKRAKLAAKSEKKAQREVADREREERKKRDQLLQEERDKQYEKERMEELKQEEAERKAREEKERKEHEEYLKMKEAFSVEGEGFDEEYREDEENLLETFLDYIKQNKVVILEDLAVHFGLKTSSVIERIQELQANGNLSGVIDDRGKFIYISQDELEAVAKFVRQRGRISITELAENSNRLINLSPGTQNSMVETR